MSLGRPGRCTSPAEIIVVTPPWSPDSMKSTARWRGVKSPKTGWQWESISPGITVEPAASITVSASSSRSRPSARTTPPSIAMESPPASGRAMSPDTICPMFLISVFTRASHGEIRAAQRLVVEQGLHRPGESDLASLDDVGAIREAPGEPQILLGEHDGESLALQ